jgi:hypothetical protein
MNKPSWRKEQQMNEQYQQDQKDKSNMENRRVLERSCKNVREKKARCPSNHV